MHPSDNKSEGSPKTDITTPFETLGPFPDLFCQSQCIAYKHEILFCGGYENSHCYSYHTVRNRYKHICSYPANDSLSGHCVVRLLDNDNPNDITLLSFGGNIKHALVMKYVSVWNEDKDSIKNEWQLLVDHHNNPVCIDRQGEYYRGARALIGGSNNHLLFITHSPKDIDVFDLHAFQFINHSILPDNINYNIGCHCFVAKKKNPHEKKKDEMILFCKETGLSIEYDEDNNTFQFYTLYVCTTMRSFRLFAYIHVDDLILFFGGYGGIEIGA
ncbi:hypothetical protein RFI_11687 [Reticulomyxa filosa]|uniref:Uncharacterized protein n=1 Tax=Reticulomyxa filosa TaxID=46433 RepID=X6NIB8_RETFI|nr:hypothetical protein RFI_11687 [Reticulomyxa filosa]|eukprot:ETO25449.1 hypothetical protein RFI_11687 [Reticulomyxa filosa]